ncbi:MULTISPECIES: SDR family NAD(P)-dependent oxidoreductase [unclassified Streptomyces]|uniref:SDR family NAD(P)-dependent oxidoreductase n=1 Tax=unclassified Streptomyces TaxID=2593676 RepID=UPI00278C1500|nr:MULTISPECIES: SDR family oxidoreductase [unclassified Streptomyces]
MSTSAGRLLDGRTALVTGASRGIGAACARALGRAGAAVAVNYLNSAGPAGQVVRDIEESGSKAIAVRGDASDAEAATALHEEVVTMLGDIDVLVCNAAGSAAAVHGSVVEAGDIIEGQIVTQFRSTMLLCRLVVPAMRARKSGSIVFIGSTESRSSAPAVPHVAVAKATQDALMRVLAAELGPEGIRVNTVAPGLVPTDGSSAAITPSVVEAVTGSTALRRLGQAEDVGDAVLALASDLSRHITGAYVPVDGGLAMH